MLIAGLMSGTSADGIDTALVEISGAPPSVHLSVVLHRTTAYPPAVHAAILAAFRPETSSSQQIARLNVQLGEVYAKAILDLIAQAGYQPEQIDLIGSHGQTIWYDAPEQIIPGAVLTLGEPAIIAERTGITTVSHLRARDLAVHARVVGDCRRATAEALAEG